MACLSTACGGGAALMHPAHTLPAQEVSLGAGVSHQVVLGDADQAMSDAIARASDGLTLEEEEAYARGALAAAILGPGSSPWVGARVGLGYHSEGGLTYTGRGVRADVRHAFEGESAALSVGLGGSGKLGHSPGGGATTDVPALDDSATRGFGVDLPLIVGWRSSSDVLQAWLGVRGGYERLQGDVSISGTPEHLEGDRWFLGGLVGLMVGVNPIWVVLELDGAYQHGQGSIERRAAESVPIPPEVLARGVEGDGRFNGFTLAPTGALLTRF